MEIVTEGLSAGAFIFASYAMVALLLVGMTAYNFVLRSKLKLLQEALNVEDTSRD